MTTTHAHDAMGAADSSDKLTPLPMAALAIAAWNLLDQTADLPQPHLISVSDLQSINMQFPGEPASARTLTRWARRFGADLTHAHHDTERGPQEWYRVEFDYYGIAVNAYAHIPAAPATTT